MLIISDVKYTLSEVVQIIKSCQHTLWRKQYLNYLIKISQSGNTRFGDYGDLLMRLGGYIMGETKHLNNPGSLERLRGKSATPNSAMVMNPIAVGKLPNNDVSAVTNIMAPGTKWKGTHHASDPETGLPKKHGVMVSEFDVNGRDGRRLTKRTQSGKTTYYYSAKHSFNSYLYQRVT